jgi:lipopolysaccharide transport system ATP-binding protein
MSTVISTQGLSKRYVIRHAGQERYLALRDVMADGARRALRRLRHPFAGTGDQAKTQEDFWALRDVSFEIGDGERVGIIGRNGAGKSTLLKILSRITEPSAGSVRIKGRVASLLEVGTGFHPELTGRENIYLNGAILGMTRAEIKRRFDEIVAFAEVERFLDTPVKRYSSGMHVRLAFSVAAHLEPDILIVDEVLAVGDAEFQRKSLGKMGSVARQGRTVLFVSHNMAAIKSLCTRGLLLREGKVAEDGEAGRVVRSYLGSVSSAPEQAGERRWRDLARAPGDQVARLVGIRACDPHGATRAQFSVQDEWLLEVEFAVFSEGHRINVNLFFYDDAGVLLFVAGDFQTTRWQREPRPVGLHRSRCTIPANLLNEGHVRVLVGLVTPPSTLRALEEEALFISVVDELRAGGARGHYPAPWPGGAFRPLLSWEYDHQALPAGTAYMAVKSEQ